MVKHKLVKGLNGYYLENEFNNQCCHKQVYHGCSSRCPLFNLTKNEVRERFELQLNCDSSGRTTFRFNQIEEGEQNNTILNQVNGKDNNNMICYKVAVRTINCFNDRVYVKASNTYYKCTNGVLYVITDTPEKIYDMFSRDNIISITTMAEGYSFTF